MATGPASAVSLEIAPVIDEKLRKVRLRKITLGLLGVALYSFAVLLLGMLLAMLLDAWTLPGNGALRPWLTLAVVATVAFGFVWGVRRVLRGAGELPWAAADVDHANPALEERWSTLTETANANLRVDEPHQGAAHPAMYRKLASEAVAWAPRVVPQQVVSPRRLSRSALLLLGAVVLLLAALLFNFQQTSVLLRRFFAPTADITLTQIASLPGEVVVAKGETSVLEVALSGRVPDEATLEVRPTDGEIKSHTLTVKRGDPSAAGKLVHRTADVQQPYAYRITAGDAQTDWHGVQVATRPRVAAVRFQVTPPAYTGKPEIRKSELPRKARVVEGSTLLVALRTADEVESCALNFGDGELTRLETDAEGWYRWQGEVTRAMAFTVELVEPHGLKNRRPQRCRIELYRDRAPIVKVVSPTAEMAVQPGDEVDIQFEASDDFAVERAELVVYGDQLDAQGNREILKSVPIDLGDMQGAKQVKGSVPLDLSEFELQNGESISYAVRVYDNRVAPALPAGDEPTLAATNTASPAQAGPSAAESPAANSVALDSAASNSAASASALAESNRGGTPSGGNNRPATNPSPSPANDSIANAPQPAASNDELPKEPNATASSGENPSASASPAAEDSAAGQVANSDAPTPGGAASEPPSDATATPGANANKLANQATGQLAEGSPSSAADGVDSATPNNAPETAATSDAAAGELANNRSANAPPASAAQSSPNQAAPDASQQGDAAPQPGSAQASSDRAPSEQETPPQSENDPAGTANNERSTTSNERRLIANDNNNAGQPNASNQPQGQQSGGQSSSGENQPQGDVVVPEGMAADATANKNQQQESAGANNQAGDTSPGGSMPRRMLNLPQSGSSQQMKLEIDEFAGSFDGQRREKTALAISPLLVKLDELLAEAEQTTLNVAKQLEAGQPWRADSQRLIDGSEKRLAECEQLVTDLQGKASDSPYAFIGLQLGLVVDTHLSPARDALWEALQSQTRREEQIRSAWQSIVRARAQLAELTASFDRVQREHKLAEAAQKIKKMYRLYIENTLPLLAPQQDEINQYQRKIAEFDLDEEYLKRLKEVLEMQRDLQAELARLLADDPRLMRRFMDRLVARGDSLRDQMTLLAERQKQLEREVRAWTAADQQQRAELLEPITRMRQSKVEEIAQLAAEQDEKFLTWMPLDLAAENPAFQEALRQSKASAAKALELAALPLGAEDRITKGRELYDQLSELDATLRSIDLGIDHEELSAHLLNRLAEVRKLVMLTSSWIRQTELLQKGDYWQEAAVEQYKLAMETDTLAGKLADIEVQVTAQVPSGTEASAKISQKAKQLLSTLDTEVAANQLAATFALRRKQETQSAAKEKAAVEAFEKTERLFDELMRATLDELDKLPVQDPITSLLEDPTLDQLLAALESEAQLAELLGIPNRPSNLQIIRDWMQPSNRGGGGGTGRMVSAELRRQAKQNQRNAEQAYRRALARALKVQRATVQKSAPQAKPAVQRVEWNSLLSTLSENLEQGDGSLPPEEYRRAIEQYLSEISKMENQRSE